MSDESIEKLNISIEDIHITIVAKYRYYSAILNKIAKIPSKCVPTAGVGFNKQGKLILVYNPEYINKLTLAEAQGVFIHEGLHIFYRHLNRFPLTTDAKLNKINNIGTDIAINQSLDKLPQGALYPEMFKDVNGKTFPRGESADWYIAELKKLDEQQQDSMDFHAGWTMVYDPETDSMRPVTEEDNVAVDYEIENVVQKMAKEVKKVLDEMKKRESGRGKFPAHLERELNNILAPKKKRHNWKKTFQMFVNSMLSKTKKLSYKRVNRRFMDEDYVMAGKKKDKRPLIVLGRDTSGTCFDDTIQAEFLNEMLEIAGHCVLKVLDCDTEVHQEYTVKRSGDFRTYKGGGGTSFIPVFERAKELGADGVIYLTDLDGTFPNIDTLYKFKKKTVWVTINDKRPRTVPFGKHLNIETEE